MRIIGIIATCFFSLFLSSCQENKERVSALTFEEMMGRNLPCWQYVVTPSDVSNLQFFKQFFERHKSAPTLQQEAPKIPTVIHFIWLGPREFPRSSVANVLSWIEKHPGWRVKFWTDRARSLPASGIEECITSGPQDSELRQCYYKTDNFAERSDILRYEILFREGGVYVDHDVKCLASFDHLHMQYDFYCGLELPADTPVSSSIHVTNNLIGSRPSHPIFERCNLFLKENWDEIDRLYPGSDKMSIIRRVANRTFTAFTSAVRELANPAAEDMIFPAYYFNAPSEKEAILARHEYAGTWFQVENHFEKMARSRLMLLSKKANQTLLLVAVAFGINLVGLVAIFCYLKKKIENHRV